MTFQAKSWKEESDSGLVWKVEFTISQNVIDELEFNFAELMIIKLATTIPDLALAIELIASKYEELLWERKHNSANLN